MKIALIGFGEAGEMFGRNLSAKANITAYDIAITPAMQAQAEAANVKLTGNQQQALAQADFIFSLVTADKAQAAAQAAAAFLTDRQIYFEMNSIAPDSKCRNADIVENLVDVAIMAPVYPEELAVPLLLAHPEAERHAERLAGLGMNVQAVGKDIGHAAAIKLCRSIMVKGMEALTLESVLTARYYGVENDVLTSLHRSFPAMGWDKDWVAYCFERVAKHGQRRAAEMHEAARMVKHAGIQSAMSKETARSEEIFSGS